MKKKFFFGVFLFVCSAIAGKVKAQNSMSNNWISISAFQTSLKSKYSLYNAVQHPMINPERESNTALLPVESNDMISNYSLFPSRSDYSITKDKQPFNFPTLAIPAVGITYGIVALHDSAPKDLNLSTKNEIREDHPYFVTHLDNYLQWSPAAAVIGLNLAGVHGEHAFGDALCVYGLSTLIMAGSVFGLKHITHEERPDHSGSNSFPSGHTATAFAAAEWLRTEYWQRSPWIGIAGYTVATTTGILRLYNNRHWMSDVVAGAAIGFLSTRIAYALNPKLVRILHTRRKKQIPEY